MLKLYRLTLLAGALFLASPAHAQTQFLEDFAGDPLSRGWKTFGDHSLFHWNAANQNLEVTWDSRRPNSFFHRPLGTILTRDDDFRLELDLRLEEMVVGIDADKPHTFQIAFGFIHLATATSPGFLRGTGFESPNLVEFNYFPDSGLGATVLPTLISTNHQFASTFNYPLEMPPGDEFRIVMVYTAASQTLVTTMTRNGEPFGPIDSVILDDTFSDIRVDHLAISSYSDVGQFPDYAGSVFARGVVDDLLLETPPAPVSDLEFMIFGNGVQAQFASRAGWVYALERSEDLRLWTDTGEAAAGTGSTVTLIDQSPPADAGFYRVRAQRP